jgi:hypothetical protein
LIFAFWHTLTAGTSRSTVDKSAALRMSANKTHWRVKLIKYFPRAAPMDDYAVPSHTLLTAAFAIRNKPDP